MSFPRYDEYKDSGVEWLGEVPAHWSVAALKRSYRIVGGSTPSSGMPEYWDGEIVWVTPADLSKLDSFGIRSSQRTITTEGLASCGTNLLPAGSIVLSTRAPIGSLGIAEVELCTNQGCKGLVPLNGQRSRFAAYLLLVMSDELHIRGRGTTFLELSADALGSIDIPIPTEAEQTAIAAFLDRETAKIDDLVAEQQNLIALLKEKRQALISHAVTRGLNPNAPMKDSGVEWLGEVPAHWDVEPCRMFVTEQTAKNDGAKDENYLSLLANVGVIPYEEKGDIGNKKPEDLSKCKLVAKGDLVINSMNYGIGSYGLSALDGVCSPVYIVLRPQLDRIHMRFALRVFENKAFQRFAQSFGNGILEHRCAINWNTLKSLKVGLPSLTEQLEILNFLDSETSKIDGLVSEAESTITVLQERRTALISAAVTGKIDVRNAVAHTEEAAA